MAELEIFVSVEPDLCTGCGMCEKTAPNVFKLGGDGVAYIQHMGRLVTGYESEFSKGGVGIPVNESDRVVQAAEECPGEIIFITGLAAREEVS